MSEKIHAVAHTILSANFTIFGGYVRDMIAGDTPVDIDVLCDTEDEHDRILLKLIKAGYSVVSNKEASEIDLTYAGSITVHKYLIDGVKVDIVIGIPDLDFVVNILNLRVNEIGVTRITRVNILQVIQNIKNRDAGPCLTQWGTDKRIQKMLNKGYKVG